MYTGTNKTALCSQQNIAEAFVKLLKQSDYSSISISCICKEAGVSRQTFYSIFESKENIVIYILDKNHTFVPGHTCCTKGTTTLPFRDLAHEYSNYIYESRDFLKLLVDNDIIYLMHDSLYQSFMNCSMFMPSETHSRRAFGAEFVAGGLSGIARIYVDNDEIAVDELENTICDLFTGQYFAQTCCDD